MICGNRFFLMVEPFSWNDEEQVLELLDQTLLPEEERWLTLRTAEGVAEAIEELRVRGAPAIGIAAASGLVLAAWGVDSDSAAKRQALEEARDRPEYPSSEQIAGLCARIDPVPPPLKRAMVRS